MAISSLIYQIEGFAKFLNDSAHNGTLSVTVDGREVQAVADSVTVDGQFACNAGEGSYYFFCSEFDCNNCDNHKKYGYIILCKHIVAPSSSI